MDSNQDFKLDEVEEKRRGGLYKLARALHLPRKMLEDAASWKRTRAAMIAIITFVTVVPAAAVTISKKTTPIEGIQLASLPTVSRPAASKSSADANLPSYLRVVDSGQKCNDRKVEVDDPDTVPGHPKLTAILMTNPCFNFGWIENDEYGAKVAVINYIPTCREDHGGCWGFPGATKDMERQAKVFREIMDMNQIGSILDAFALDMVRKLSGPAMVEEVKKLAAKLEQETKRSASKNSKLDQADEEIIFWNTVQKVAISEGLSVRLSDATREREACGKLPGDIRVPGGTGDCFKKIFARMSPSDWEKYHMKSGFAWFTYKDGNYEEAIKLYKEARSQLRLPQDLERADLDAKQNFPNIADQILSS